MKNVERLLAAQRRAFIVIAAHAAGPTKLVVAIEVYVHESKEAATCIVALDLDTLAVELVHETTVASVDYLHVDGWHGLLQLGAIVEIEKQQPRITKLGKPGGFAQLARRGDTTLVVGTSENSGFVARVEGGKLATILDGVVGPLYTVCIGRKHIWAGGGIRGTDLKYQLFRGDAKKLGTVIPLSPGALVSLHETTDGTVMIGGEREATIYAKGKVQPVAGVWGDVADVVEFRGTEYWLSFDRSDRLAIWTRDGTKLKKKWETKYHFDGNRGAPLVRMTATEDRLVVSNKDRIHLFDGKTWSQLAIQPNVAKLFKRLPAAMKK